MDESKSENSWRKPLNFKPPVASYSREMDLIRVQIRNDCYVTPVRVNSILDILEANDQNKEYVGFVIKSAMQLCLEYGLRYRGSLVLSELIDKIFEMTPCPTQYQDEIYRILLSSPSCVRIPDPVNTD